MGRRFQEISQCGGWDFNTIYCAERTCSAPWAKSYKVEELVLGKSGFNDYCNESPLLDLVMFGNWDYRFAFGQEDVTSPLADDPEARFA